MSEMSYQEPDFIYVKENALTEEQCQIITQYIDNSKLHKTTFYYQAYGHQSEFGFVTDIVYQNVLKYMEEHPFLKSLYKPFGIDKAWNLQKYLPGQSYSIEHFEHGAEPENCRRILAWMFYLNDVEDGGETYWPQQNFKKTARAGDFCIWPAGWTHSHKGLVSNTEFKYIITGWCSLQQ